MSTHTKSNPPAPLRLRRIREPEDAICEWCGVHFVMLPPVAVYWDHKADDDSFPICLTCFWEDVR